MKRRTLFGILFALSVIALISVFTESDKIEYNAQKAFSKQGINFDGRAGATGPLSRVPEFVEAANNHPVKGQITIKLSFNAQSVGTYGNVFQTAPLNDGLRLELAKPNTAALIVGAHNPAGFLPYVLTSQLKLRQWHTLSLTVDGSNRIVAVYDGQKIVDATDPELAYSISDVTFGTGFSKQRHFDGQIKDASISYSVLVSTPSGQFTVTALRVIFFILSIIFLLLASLGGGRAWTEMMQRRATVRAAKPARTRSASSVDLNDDGDLPL